MSKRKVHRHKVKKHIKRGVKRKHRGIRHKSSPEKLLHAQVLSGSSANIIGGFKW